MEQNNYFLGHMEDLAEKALKAGIAASRFLTPAEARSIAEHFKFKRTAPSFDGGYDEAERVRALFLNPDWGQYKRAELFAALKLEFRQQDTLGHRDILGALMALGIERDCVGDIICGDSFNAVICVPEMGAYICENLTKAGRVGIKAREVGLEELLVENEEPKIKTATVASLRLDAVLSAAFGLSRGKTSELIAAGKVNLNHLLCEAPAKELNEGDLLSVRGLGRVRLVEVGGISRKGRVFLKIGVYGK